MKTLSKGSKILYGHNNWKSFECGASEAAEGCLASIAVKLVKTATRIIFANFQTYIRVKINRASKFGPFLLDFRTLCDLISNHTMSLWLMKKVSSLWQPHSALCLNSKILNFSNNHFGHLTSHIFVNSEGRNHATWFNKMEKNYKFLFAT